MSLPRVIDLAERKKVIAGLEAPLEGHLGWVGVHVTGQVNRFVQRYAVYKTSRENVDEKTFALRTGSQRQSRTNSTNTILLEQNIYNFTTRLVKVRVEQLTQSLSCKLERI